MSLASVSEKFDPEPQMVDVDEVVAEAVAVPAVEARSLPSEGDSEYSV
jgi:hypothetical protein